MNKFTRLSNNLKQSQKLIASISSLSELSILGVQKDSHLFDQFIEDKIIEEFVKINKINQRYKYRMSHQIQMLMQIILLTDQYKYQQKIGCASFFALIKRIIIYNYDLNNEETQDYYLNFIKILLNKVTKENINLIFNQKQTQFLCYYIHKTFLMLKIIQQEHIQDIYYYQYFKLQKIANWKNNY